MYLRQAKELKQGDKVLVKKTKNIVTVERIEIGQKVVRIYCSDGYMHYHNELKIKEK